MRYLDVILKRLLFRMPCACKVSVPYYPDNAEWGPLFWTILHGLAEKAGRAVIQADEAREWKKFIKETGDVLPCDDCRQHFQKFLEINPITQLHTIPYNTIKDFLKNWFFTLHNDVNARKGYPIFIYADLEVKYSSIDFRDTLWRLEPVMKKVIQLSGVSLMKWKNWIHSLKMLKATLSIP